jgi:hypothetical protein
MKLLKIILAFPLPLFLILGCKKSDDSSTSSTTSTTSTASCTADTTSTTLINIGAKIGRLMETTQLAINPEGEGGHKISELEKKHITKAINDVEDKILELKLLVERANKLSEIK